MSFTCQICRVAMPPCTKPVLLVAEVRQVNYPNHDDPSSPFKGSEIVRELRACPTCAKVREGEVIQ